MTSGSRSAVVTGAFGFAGANLVEQLVKKEYKVYAVGRRMPSLEDSGKTHNDRLTDLPGVKKVFLEMEEYDRLPDFIDSEDKPDLFFHLAWGGMNPGAKTQQTFVDGALKALDAAKEISPSIRFIGVGSQAEYGLVPHGMEITEDTPCKPVTDYGIYKLKACKLLRERAGLLEMDFIWVRLFSLIGKYEPEGRMLPGLMNALVNDNSMKLSSCTQYWDYLDAKDAADAMIAVAEKGKAGEIYNIASAGPRILKEYVKEVLTETKADPDLVIFGEDADPYISVRPSIKKLTEDTGWTPKTPFRESLKHYR